MIDAFEIRLADLLADALIGADNLGPIGRIDSVDAPNRGQVGIQVSIADFLPQMQVSDDRPVRLRDAGQIRLRPTFHLGGTAAIHLTSNPPSGQQSSQARARLVAMLDRVLLALHPEGVRTGRAFDTGVDLGFELFSFRLARVEPVDGETPNPLVTTLMYGFEGRFWPVEQHPEGDVITTLPTRLTTMPVALPEARVARAGGDNLSLPLRLDLTASGGAALVLAARIEGAAAPGALVGDGTSVPAGFTGFAIGTDGISDIVYQPPATLGAATQVRIETRLAHPDRPSIPLTRFTIEVLAS